MNVMTNFVQSSISVLPCNDKTRSALPIVNEYEKPRSEFLGIDEILK